MTLPISEVFGPVYQGEGPHTGRLCSFVRLGLCNLHCSWCDTPYTWDRTRYDLTEECPPHTDRWVLDQLTTHDTTLLVLTGGEPLIHQGNPVLLDILDQWPWAVHVETNGTLSPSTRLLAEVEHFSVSPKLGNGGDPETRRLNPAALAQFAALPRDRVAFKFVATSPDDITEVTQLVRRFPIPSSQVWIMPEGTTTAGILATAKELEPHILERGYNLTLRQHILLHGTERGH